MKFNKIFFSYSRADASEFAIKLALDLKKAGLGIWMDQLDIRAGSVWDIEIENALETCDCLLFIQSKQSVNSNNVLNEVYYAIEQNKRVIPLIIHTCKTPFRLTRLHYISFINDYDRGLQNLLAELTTADIHRENEIQSNKNSTRRSAITSKAALIIVAVALAVAATIFWRSNTIHTSGKNENELTVKDTGVNKNISEMAKPLDSSKIKATPLNNDKTKGSLHRAETENLMEAFTGSWGLSDVTPKAVSKEGILKIEEAGANKIKIDGRYQFEFFKHNDTAYFTVFNGDASCLACEFKREMQIPDHVVTVSTQRHNSSGITELQVSVDLFFQNKNQIMIQVKLSAPVEVDSGLTIQPFQYSFIFSKLPD